MNYFTDICPQLGPSLISDRYRWGGSQSFSHNQMKIIQRCLHRCSVPVIYPGCWSDFYFWSTRWISVQVFHPCFFHLCLQVISNPVQKSNVGLKLWLIPVRVHNPSQDVAQKRPDGMVQVEIMRCSERSSWLDKEPLSPLCDTIAL